MREVSSGTLLAIAALPVGLLVTFLFIQNQRQGWPFPQHVQTPVARSAALPADRDAPGFAAARVAVPAPANQVEMLGVQLERAELRTLDNPVHAVATIVIDESRLVHVHPRVAGWLEALYVNTTGQPVRAGKPLGGVFSQELYASQSEYLSTRRRASSSGLASAVLEAARTRLKVLGMSESEILRIEQTGQARRLVTISAPISGIVLNRAVSQGTAVDPSVEILTLADLSQVWVIAELAEADAAQVRTGMAATLNFPMSGREPFAGSVQFVYPTLTERTRTVRVRMTAANADGALRPGMYGSAVLPIAARQTLTVGRDAVVDTGQSQHVFVRTSKDMLEPRRVKVGARLADRVEILEGLAAGEQVVTAGVFLIDSESRLRASGGTAHAGHGKGPPQDQAKQPDESVRHEHPP